MKPSRFFLLGCFFLALTLPSAAEVECKVPQDIADEEKAMLADMEAKENAAFIALQERGASDEEMAAALDKIYKERDQKRIPINSKMLDAVAKCEEQNN